MNAYERLMLRSTGCGLLWRGLHAATSIKIGVERLSLAVHTLKLLR